MTFLTRTVKISLGDTRSYFVTTARNDLGVIFATSEAGQNIVVPLVLDSNSVTLPLTGATLEPISWQEMRCPKTGKVEKRKCAKPEGL
jgi:exosome complex component CSL4